MNQVKSGDRMLTPGKVVCVGRNFVEHISELGNEVPSEMVIFAKPNSAISDQLNLDPKDTIHYEAEFSFLVEGGQLAAVAFGLDLTKRGLQTRLKEKGLPWERAKAFDGSALFSEFIPLPSAYDSLELRLQINGPIVQHGLIKQMIYPPQAILDEIQSFMTLNDGDIIMTGTPKGVGPIQADDNLLGELCLNGERLVECSWEAVCSP